MVDDANRNALAVVGEAPKRPKSTELDRKTMTVVVTTAAARLRQVRWRKQPVARELLVGRVERERGVAATHASSSRMRRTDVRPMASRRAISALLTPSRKSPRTCFDFRDAERGRPR